MVRLCNPDQLILEASQVRLNSQPSPIVTVGKPSLQLPGRRDFKPRSSAKAKSPVEKKTRPASKKRKSNCEVMDDEESKKRVDSRRSSLVGPRSASVVSAASSDWYLPSYLANEIDPLKFR